MGTRDRAKEKGWEWEEDGERREITLAAMERGGEGGKEREREGKSAREESTEQERGEGGGPQSIDPPWRRR